MATSSIPTSGFTNPGLGSSFASGENYNMLMKSVSVQARVPSRPTRAQPMMKNVNEGKGIFAPLVVVTRNIVGKKRFNQLRGKAIALHSQVNLHQTFEKPKFACNFCCFTYIYMEFV